MDAFFASVEQRDNTDLRGKPVAVGSAKARGVVAAASYEARVFGVRSAMPSVTALRKCPDLIFVPHRFDVYRSVSAQIHKIFAQHTPLIEPLSLDEAFLDVTEACASGKLARDIAEEIRAAILQDTRLTASAGVSYNKFLAKIASDQNKPDGLTVIAPQQALDFISTLPVGRFHGVGPVTQKKMNGLGISTGADLRAKELHWLAQHFGSSSQHYYNISRGIDLRPVNPTRIRKSIGAEETFLEDIFDLQLAAKMLAPIADKVSCRCQDKGVVGRTITLKVKYADFEQVTRRQTVQEPTADADRILEISEALLAGLFPFRSGIRLLGITSSGLTQPDHSQPNQLDMMHLFR